MNKILISVIGFITVTSILMSCVGDGGLASTEICVNENGVVCQNNVFNDFIQPIFSDNCAGCHQGAADAFASLSLEEGKAWSNLVGIPTNEKPLESPTIRVVKGIPDSSYLYQKISSDSPKDGGKMPLTGNLTAEQIKTIKLWIECGAPGPGTEFNREPCPGLTGPKIDTLAPNFYTDSVQSVFDMNCTGCHANQGPGWWPTGADTNGLDLSPDSSYKYLFNVIAYGDTVRPRTILRVKPNSSKESSLYNKVIADFDSVWFGTPMPAGFALINSDPVGVENIRRWIDCGAPAPTAVKIVCDK